MGTKRPAPKSNAATNIVDTLISNLELFHDKNGTPWSRLPVNNHYEVTPLRSRAFREWVAYNFYKKNNQAANTSAIETALTILSSQAVTYGPTQEVFIRRAEHNGNVYIDLCNDKWQVVEITPNGWDIIDNSPVPFARKRGMEPLPFPQRDGYVEDLRPFLNLTTDADWYLVVGWLLATYSAGPYPVLVFGGEQGTGKSTQTKILRCLADPNEAPIRSKPRNEADLMISAQNSWVLGVDNLSTLPEWFSDALCRLSTGGGYSTRELWTNDEETIIHVKRPIILNGITDIVNRGDLMDRSLLVTLPVLPDSRRETERDFWEKFEGAKPGILGAIFDLLVVILNDLPHVQLQSRPRMLDFAKWVSAAEAGLDWPRGMFLKAYVENREGANQSILEDSTLATAIMDLVKRQDWEGTAAELLKETTSAAMGMPGTNYFLTLNPKRLAGDLKRLAPNLRASGIDVLFQKTRKRGKYERLITIKNQSLFMGQQVP